MRPHGKVKIQRSAPRAQAICDRCGFAYNHYNLRWQYDWIGPKLLNERILVCQSCYDVPQEQLRTIVIPPDPIPVDNPRPEAFNLADSPISYQGFDPATMVPGSPLGTNTAYTGTLTHGGGVTAPFYGTPNKALGLSAYTPVSVSGFNNYVQVNWSAIPGSPTIANPSSAGAVTQSYSIASVTAYAPFNAPFLGSSATGYQFAGSNDAVFWTTLATGTTVGSIGEVVTINSSQLATAPFAYHRFILQGDATTTVALSLLEINSFGQSAAATGSELGA